MKKKPIESVSHFLKISAAASIAAAVIAFAASGLASSNASTVLSNVQSGTVSTVRNGEAPFSIPSSPENPRGKPSAQPQININSATAEELQALSGIGAAKAAAIVAYREEHGAFSDISEIMRVSGIGEAIFEKIRGSITTGSPEGPREELSEPPAQPRININAATAEELQTLSGIGAAKAAAIVAYREEHGAFSDISEIMRVSGIGEVVFENIRGKITV